jgi:valyl-tRNA synthetase
MIGVLSLDAKINEHGPAAYQGLDRFEARKKIVADLDAQGLLVETKKHKLMVPRCARTGQIVEPMLTDQWFVAMNKPGAGGKSIAQQAIEAVSSGEVRFVPEQWVNTYNHWMNNIQDWCISRQLWWGHQIPAWYGTGGELFVARSEEEARQRATGRLHGPADARRGRARHLVQLGPGALQHAGWPARPSSRTCSCPARCWSRASTSSSSGSPG